MLGFALPKEGVSGSCPSSGGIVADPDVLAGGADGQEERGLLFRRTPLAAGTAGTAAAIIVGIAALFRHTPPPDVPPGDTRTQLAAVVAGPTATLEGVHVALPKGWTFARYAHSPQLISHVNLPGLGQVPIGPSRRVIFAAQRSPGKCVVILERDRIEHMNLDEDAAALKQTIAQNSYERNLFKWFTTSRDARFQQFVNTADEMLNRPGPATRMIGFTRTSESAVSLGHQPARLMVFAATLNGRETDVLTYAVSHQWQWQYALIGLIDEPPRACTLELGWIEGRLSFE
jgi:hypothetical protein